MSRTARKSEAGFSLIELSIAMAATLVVLGVATTMLGGVFNIRARENQRSDALADAQRAINLMSREIANSGFGLTNNGLWAADSYGNEIHFRANLNAYGGAGNVNATSDTDEDIYYVETEGNLIRVDVNSGNTTMLARRIDSLNIRYFDRRVTYNSDATDCSINATLNGATELTNSADKSNVRYILITVCVNLQAVGRPGGAGFQPASQVKLVSDVVLRNASTTLSSY